MSEPLRVVGQRMRCPVCGNYVPRFIEYSVPTSNPPTERELKYPVVELVFIHFDDEKPSCRTTVELPYWNDWIKPFSWDLQ